jgi:hypothetical protein
MRGIVTIPPPQLSILVQARQLQGPEHALSALHPWPTRTATFDHPRRILGYLPNLESDWNKIFMRCKKDSCQTTDHQLFPSYSRRLLR